LLDLEADQLRDAQPEVVAADLQAAGDLDGGAVPAGLHRDDHRAGDAVEGQLAGQPQVEDSSGQPQRRQAERDRAGQREGGRREAVQLQSAVVHGPVTLLQVGMQLVHVHGESRCGDGAIGDGD